MSDVPSFQFPDTWENNDRSQTQYDTCGAHFDNVEAFINHYNKGMTFHVICIIFLIYYGLGAFLFLRCRKSYEIRKYNMAMVLLYLLGAIVNVLMNYLNQVYKKIIIINNYKKK